MGYFTWRVSFQQHLFCAQKPFQNNKSRSKMSKYIFCLGLIFIVMAVIEINAQDIHENIKNFGAQLDDLGDQFKKLGIDGNDQIQDALNKAKDALNSSVPLNFSFVTVIMALFYTYIVG